MSTPAHHIQTYQNNQQTKKNENLSTTNGKMHMLLHANNLSFQLAVTATRHKLDIHVSLQEAPADIREDVRGEHHQQAEAPCQGILDGG